MNQVSFELRAQIINCLIAGNSIHSTERMTVVYRCQSESQNLTIR
jgi:hypothetical protein